MIGVLALQGCVEPHLNHLRALGAEAREVKRVADLEGIHGLILPGGESTTMLKLLKVFGLWDGLRVLADRVPFWGVCAGSILMAKQVTNPGQDSLGVMDVEVVRNAYGRQLESFEGEVDLTGGSREPAVFIRAPKFARWGERVKVMGKVQGEAAWLDDGFHMVTAFHPELTGSGWFHRRFLERCQPR